jgi:DNA-binding transcriptional LysR family regulator
MKHIKGKDLNLMMVFAALWKQRNVTIAAQTIGMTQPALSRALGRLRVELNDPLFVRAARGIVPTAKAMQIADEILGTLAALERIYSNEKQFHPASFCDVMTILTSDYFETIAAKSLLPVLAKEAPGLILNFRSGVGVVPKDAMEKGEIDLVVAGIYETLPEGFYQQKILTDRYRSAIRMGHPLKNLTIQNFVKLPHILVTPKGDLSGIVDVSLKKIGRKRHVAVGFSNFLSAGWMIAHTDHVLSAPGKMIECLKEFLPIRDFPTPVSLPNLELYQVWHARSHHNAAHRWLRQKIIECCC